MKKLFFTLGVICTCLSLPVHSLVALTASVSTNDDWVDMVTSPGAYTHVRDGNIQSLSPEEYVNRYRAMLGLPPLTISSLLRQSAQNHTNYQNTHGVYEGNAHGENPTLSLFTGEDPAERCDTVGYTGSCSEVQAYGTGDFYAGIDGWMMTPFHRMGLLSPYISEIGCASSGRWFVCDMGMIGSLSAEDFPETILYPADGQVIGTSFPVYETPNPYPGYEGETIGPTLMFWRLFDGITGTPKISLYNLTDKKSIPTILSIDTTNLYAMGALLFNPLEPLALNHEYAVRVYDASLVAAYDQHWTFKTQKSSNVDFPNADQTITYDAHVAWADPAGEEYLVSVPSTEIDALIDRLQGDIMLAVDHFGEAWYIDPVSRARYYLKDGPTAYEFLRTFGLGITDSDLATIPSEDDATGGGELAEKLSGRILLQVEEHGEAWYVNPSDLKRYYMENGEEAYRMMRELSVGTMMMWISGIPVGGVQWK